MSPPAEPAEDDPPGPEVSIGPSALMVALIWPLMHAAGTDDGIALSALIGLGGGLAVAAVSAFGAGMLEGAVGPRRAASSAFAVACAGAAIYWWRSLPWWGAAILSLLAVIGWVSLWRRESALPAVAPRRVELPDRARAELSALPTLGAELAGQRDAVVDGYTRVERAAIELGGDGLVDGRALRRDAEETLVAALRQIRRLHEAGDDPHNQGLRAEGRARLDRLSGALRTTHARLLAFLQARDEGQTPDLEAHAEQLRHAATGLREVGDLEP